jgi:hypothetical protein
MPVTAQFPTRLCVDVEALTTRRAELEDALLAAFLRTFAVAQQAVVEPRGGYLGIKFELPTFVWTGDGLDEAPDTLRAEIETLVDDTLWRAAEAAGVFDLARAAQLAPPVLPPNPAEPADTERDEDSLDLYILPTYQKQGRKVAVPKKGKRVRQQGEDEVTEALRWRRIRTGAQMAKDLQAAVRESLKALGRTLPKTGQIGVIYKIGDNYGIEVIELPGAKILFSGQVPNPTRPEIKPGKGVQMKSVPLAVVQTDAKLKWYAPGTTLVERIKAFTDFYGADIRFQIQRRAKKAGQVALSEVKDQLETMVQEHVRDAIKNIPDCNFMTLELGSAQYLFFVPTDQFGADVLQKIDTELLPLVEWHEVGRKKKGDGKGAKGAGQGERKGAGQGGEGQPGQGAGAGAGTGINEDGEAGEGPGAIVYTEEEAKGPGGRLYPPSYYSDSGPQDCSAFLGEPELSQLGEVGERMRVLIQEIAQKLQIQPCEHAGRFAIVAAGAISGRAAAVGEHAARTQDKGFTQPGSFSESAMRKLLFVPTVSPAIQFMRFLAGIVPLLQRLDDMIWETYRTYAHLITGMYAGEAPGWFLHYRYDFSDNIKLGVTFIFLTTCRALLLQLLRTSHQEIMKRISNFESYAPMFEELARSQLLAVDELIRLHQQLQSEIEGISVGTVVRGIGDTWADARLGLENLFEGTEGSAVVVINRTPGTIVRDAAGKPTGIADSMGHLWTLPRLEQAIQLRRGSAEAVDPLIKQLTDIPEVAARMRANPFYLRVELLRLLLEMKSNNEDQTEDAVDSVMHAFRVSKIDEVRDGSKHTIYNAPYNLTGIHLMAHNQVGEFFGGSFWYAEGIKSLFNAELGLEDLGTFFEWTGLILLGVLCPPAAFIAGAAVATYHYHEAKEKEELFRSLINPDELMSWAEVEAELFAAKLGLVLSFIPEAGTLLRAGSKIATTAVRQGARQGAKAAVRALRDRFAREMAQSLAKGVERAIIREVVTDQVMGKLFEHILGPITQAIAADAALTGPAGGRSAVMRVMLALEAEQAQLAGPGLAEDL